MHIVFIEHTIMIFIQNEWTLLVYSEYSVQQRQWVKKNARNYIKRILTHECITSMVFDLTFFCFSLLVYLLCLHLHWSAQQTKWQLHLKMFSEREKNNIIEWIKNRKSKCACDCECMALGWIIIMNRQQIYTNDDANSS